MSETQMQTWGTENGETLYGVTSGASPHDAIYGLGGNDELIGYDGYDVLEGGAGSDTLWGNGGNDRLYGGIKSHRDAGIRSGDGSNTLKGGHGTDSYYVATTPGTVDHIYESSGALDEVILPENLWVDDTVSLYRSGVDSLVIAVGTGADQSEIVLHNQLRGGDYVIERLWAEDPSAGWTFFYLPTDFSNDGSFYYDSYYQRYTQPGADHPGGTILSISGPDHGVSHSVPATRLEPEDGAVTETPVTVGPVLEAYEIGDVVSFLMPSAEDYQEGAQADLPLVA